MAVDTSVDAKRDPTSAPTPTADGPQQALGAQKLLDYLQHTPKPDPLYVASMLRRNATDNNAMIALLQSRLGNAFVQQVIAAGKTLATSAPEPSSPLPALIPDGTVIDSPLGKVVSASATTTAEVAIPVAEAVVTSISGFTPLITFTAKIPLADIHANDVTPEMLAQIANVTLVGGIGGTLAYQLGGGFLQVTLTDANSTKALNLARYKLWLSSGTTVMLTINSATTHLEKSAVDRSETRSEISNELQMISQLQGQLANMQTEPGPNGKPHTQAAIDSMGFSEDIAHQQSRLAQSQQALAAENGPSYVTLDRNGAPIKAP